jgi:Fe-only nitrogenase accessory protein AnfO
MPQDNFAIAVFKKEDGDLAELHETNRIFLFQKEGEVFRVAKILDFDFKGALGLCGMRKRLNELILLIPEAKALAARAFPGISRDVLTRAGFILYELNRFEEEVLRGIEEEGEGLYEEEGEGKATPCAPYEEHPGSGSYFLDLRASLNAYPDLTTKKILRPFFDGTSFSELKVIYDHLPPWLPQELKTRKLSWDSEDVKGGTFIRIYPIKEERDG